jgi:UDP-N-acetylmuramoylalanine--D-glutamate ligase
VIGHAREGASAARYLSKDGAEVTATDSKLQDSQCGYRTVFGSESTDLLDGVDTVVTSPGVPDTNPLLAAARTRSIQITNPTQIFFDRCPCPITGITGSSGKSTTSALIAAILKAAGRHVLLGGNIGVPMLDLLAGLDGDSTAVLELSSFQLEILRSSPQLAVLTNISPNHLDRHRSMGRYIAAKSNIVTHQSSIDTAVLNLDDPVLREIGERATGSVCWFSRRASLSDGAFLLGDTLIQARDGVETGVLPASEVALPGAHNLENVLAAIAATAVLGVDITPMRDGVTGFRGLPHRLSLVCVIDGVSFVDDSIATSPGRAAVALHATDSPIIWLAGGRSKGLPWSPVIEAMAGKVRSCILIGEAADEIAAALTQGGGPTPEIVRAKTMTDAVVKARELARTGDTVLLAPGCTSYDMFANFEERGDAFSMAVEESDGHHR